METISAWNSALNGVVWGPWMLVLIGVTGLYLMGGLGMMPLVRFTTAVRLLMEGRHKRGKGDITPFNALMTSLAATIGTGNIAGVATAIFLGGPGALFWMWCTALVGMATKYGEALLAVKYRESDHEGYHHGGPMYYIKNGLGEKWKWLAFLFALFGMLAGFGIGNMVQSNSVADALQNAFQIPRIATGITSAILVGLVLIGGIKTIAQVAGKLVPVMGIMYLLGGLTVITIHLDQIPSVLALVFEYAFTPHAAAGGFAGSTLWMAMRYGVARGVFSNEAGLGSAPIAHASASTNHPVEQGMVAMLGTFIDTILVCTVTGFVILLSGLWTEGYTGAALSSNAFEQVLPGVGHNIVTFGLVIFALTTILGWSVYGEKCAYYLMGPKSVIWFRVVWVLAVPIGTMIKLELAWAIADTLNALMAIPNLVALLLLSPVIFSTTKEYFLK